MLKATPDVKEKGVIIGYDARHNSRRFTTILTHLIFHSRMFFLSFFRFAELAANVLLNLGIKVYLFSKITPTPFVVITKFLSLVNMFSSFVMQPFGVLRLKTDWGIMVTASHNPKQDNGYKVSSIIMFSLHKMDQFLNHSSGLFPKWCSSRCLFF
jgi:phosphoglucomutase/phosphopentomutase